MGAQVVRCVGRAYRHAGRDYLHHNTKLANVLDHYSVPVRQQWRKAKAFWTAVLAASRATVSEQVVYRQAKRHRQSREKGKKDTSSEIDYFTQGLGNFQDNTDDEAMFSDDASESDDEEERQFTEKLRAKQTMLTSLQIEALWKVAKIDLDKVILAACRLILTQQYFFPSHQTMDVQNGSSSHGWVTITGRVMDAKEALQRTAEALIFLGDIMVERSKVETAWKE